MKKSYKLMLPAVMAVTLAACIDEYLTTQPQTIVTDELVWTDPAMVRGVIADFYGRLPQYLTFGPVPTAFAAYDEAIWSGIITVPGAPNALQVYPYNRWSLWNGTQPGQATPANQGPAGTSWGLVRDINLAIENIERASSPTLNPLKSQFLAELRYQRAWVYFEHVKRMGGVPILTSQMLYDFSGDPGSLQVPRSSEAEVYEFIWNELEAIKGQLGNAGSKRQANRGTALALQSRAMLYAGSLARHNNEMPVPITLPGGVVGIPANKANEYYEKSLQASRELINSGMYSLYNGNSHRGQNFYEAYTNKSGNPEVIWVRDYSVGAGRTHITTVEIIPRSMRIDINGAGLSPTLQFVETFDYLNGAPGTIPGARGPGRPQSDWIFYDNISDPFEAVNGGKDWRLYGTVIYPGASARGQRIDIQAGVYQWNAAQNRYDRFEGAPGTTHTDGRTLTGVDGPRPSDSYMGNTGFYVRKLLDSAPAAATNSTGSEMWWVFFRLGEIYLNAAEAAFELGLQPEALGYMNTLRQRAGFPPNSLTTLSRAKIRDERRIELAFEDHRLWDIIRWRIAHQIWDGSRTSTTANAWHLYPYRIVHPGHPNDGKYVFDKDQAPIQLQPRFFRMGNYYSEIPEAALGNNPQLIANPFH
jgi:starch-binding outer membrane protein, SusD/RagB family